MNNRFSIDIRVSSQLTGDFRIGFDEASRTVWSLYRPDEYQLDDNSRRLLPEICEAMKQELKDILSQPFEHPADGPITATIKGSDSANAIDMVIAPSLFRQLAGIINTRLREPIVEDLVDYISGNG